MNKKLVKPYPNIFNQYTIGISSREILNFIDFYKTNLNISDEE
jgi:hypothetical protein